MGMNDESPRVRVTQDDLAAYDKVAHDPPRPGGALTVQCVPRPHQPVLAALRLTPRVPLGSAKTRIRDGHP